MFLAGLYGRVFGLIVFIGGVLGLVALLIVTATRSGVEGHLGPLGAPAPIVVILVVLMNVVALELGWMAIRGQASLSESDINVRFPPLGIGMLLIVGIAVVGLGRSAVAWIRSELETDVLAPTAETFVVVMSLLVYVFLRLASGLYRLSHE